MAIAEPWRKYNACLNMVPMQLQRLHIQDEAGPAQLSLGDDREGV